MAAKIKSMIPTVISQDRQTVSGPDDNQQLIRSRSVRASARRRPRFSVRSTKAPKTRKSERIRQTKQVFDPFEVQQVQQSNGNGAEAEQPIKKKKRRTPLKIVRSAGKRIEWIFKKGARYFGLAIIKIFNQPDLYTQDSRIYVA